jgi:predicted lipoprotein with Yx(FWY)xxD motif
MRLLRSHHTQRIIMNDMHSAAGAFRPARPLSLLGIGLAALLLAACSGGVGSGATASSTGSSGAASAIQLKVSQSGLGMILTDATGRTLYAFTKDTAEKSACNGDCATKWPALTVPAGQQASAGDGTTGEWIHSITRDDGASQVSYGGHPLYYYAPDKAAGDTNGQGVGGVWFAVTGDGQLVEASAPASASPSAGASGSGVGSYNY